VRGGGRRRRQRRGASYPLFEFIHRGLVEVSISLSGSGSSINFPIQRPSIRATWLQLPVIEPLIGALFLKLK
jgi:hypothetical protein